MFQDATLSTMGPESMGGLPHNFGYGGIAWPSANMAFFTPVRVPHRMTLTKLGLFNASVVSGNWDIGIYDPSGRRLVSTGSTAQSGAYVMQAVDVADSEIGPGLFYFAAVMDNTTSQVYRMVPNNSNVDIVRLLTGCVQMASAFPLPATATFATLAYLFSPVVAASGRMAVL